MANQVSYDTGRIHWTYRGQNVSGFRVEAGTVSGIYPFALTISDPSARHVLVKEVVPGPGIYFCTVTSINAVGEATSAEASFEAMPSPPSAPGGISFSSILAFLLSFWISAQPVQATVSDFNGTTSSMEIASWLPGNTFTICQYTRREGDGESSIGRYWDWGDNTRLRVFGADVQMQVPDWTTDGAWDIAKPAVNTPIFICTSYNGSADTNDPTFCINGASEALVLDNNGSGGTFTPGTVFNFGSDGGGGATFDGQMGDGSLWTEVFTCEQSRAVMHYGPFARPKGLVTYLPMGSFDGRDHSGNGNNFTIASISTLSTGPYRSSIQGGFIWLGQ